MIRTINYSLHRTGAITGLLLLFLTAAWHAMGARPGDPQQAGTSSQSRTGQSGETDQLAAEQEAQLEALGYVQGSVKAT